MFRPVDMDGSLVDEVGRFGVGGVFGRNCLEAIGQSPRDLHKDTRFDAIS